MLHVYCNYDQVQTIKMFQRVSTCVLCAMCTTDNDGEYIQNLSMTSTTGTDMFEHVGDLNK